ncbi:MAG TPA: SCP2 sterol-binding domain-containing protein [Pseudomonadota bacterium]|nr:SCP2 sterol-binding domain-containing protein [Xanthomonadales bacterium]HQW63959.1 SCP2 sterol-binding domain-containing protein [Pseudomonadota bacterium]HQX26004.1 SCP2 sterol-binding domain-containing protein [Pseudomonadota bacterium]HQY37171.1 SCP2 sterol-binding domain-containing protein [Pseudomonadota bacterium]
MSTDRPPNPLLALAGGALEEVLNRTLALDPASAQRIAPLEGRSVELSWSAADLGLRLDVNDGRLRVGPRARGPAPDLSVASTLSGLAGMLLPGAAGGGLPTGKVQMSGDADLARRLSQLAERFEPDLEEAFARRFGIAFGPQLARGLRSAFDWARESSGSLARDAASYVRDERGDVAARAELDGFHDEVDHLRDDVERLAARVAKLGPGPGPRA